MILKFLIKLNRAEAEEKHIPTYIRTYRYALITETLQGGHLPAAS